jgi:Cupin-like domain
MGDTRYPWDLTRVPNYDTAPCVMTVDVTRLDEETFRRQYVELNRPCLIKRAVTHWPAFSKWPAPEYLNRKIGDFEVQASVSPKVEAFGLRSRDLDIQARKMTLDEMLPAMKMRLVFEGLRTPDDEVLFAEVGPNSEAVRCLEEDLEAEGARFPFLPKLPHPRFMYKGWGVMFYKNSYSDWHFHPGTDAIMCQALGTKDVLLLPPTQAAWEQIVPIHVKQWNVYDVDLAKAPGYREVRPIRVTVEPGDGLFLPVNWWHAVQGRPREYGITVPITWNSSYRDLRQPATRHFVSVLWKHKKPLAAAALAAGLYSTIANRIRESAER